METRSELQRENRELVERKEVLQLRQENRVLKRQIARLESGKTAIADKHPAPLSLRLVVYFAYALSVVAIILIIARAIFG